MRRPKKSQTPVRTHGEVLLFQSSVNTLRLSGLPDKVYQVPVGCKPVTFDSYRETGIA